MAFTNRRAKRLVAFHDHYANTPSRPADVAANCRGSTSLLCDGASLSIGNRVIALRPPVTLGDSDLVDESDDAVNFAAELDA